MLVDHGTSRSPHTDDAAKRRGTEHAIRMAGTTGTPPPNRERNLLWAGLTLAVWVLMLLAFLLTALGPRG